MSVNGQNRAKINVPLAREVGHVIKVEDGPDQEIGREKDRGHVTVVVENQGHAIGGQSLEIEGQGHEIGGQSLEVGGQGRADVVQGRAKNGVRGQDREIDGLDHVTAEKNLDQIHVSDEEAGHVIVKDDDQGHKNYFTFSNSVPPSNFTLNSYIVNFNFILRALPFLLLFFFLTFSTAFS